MNRSFIKFTGSISLMMLCWVASSQDIIQLSSGEVLEVKVVESSEKEIKYKLMDYREGPEFVLKKNKILSTTYANGFVERNLMWDNPRFNRPTSIGIGLSVLYSAEGYNYFRVGHFITPRIELQLESVSYLFTDSNLALGTNYHFNSLNSSRAISPFIGLMVGNQGYSNSFDSEESQGPLRLRIPIGLNYAGKKGLGMSLSINQGPLGYGFNNEGFVAFAIGYRWKRTTK